MGANSVIAMENKENARVAYITIGQWRYE